MTIDIQDIINQKQKDEIWRKLKYVKPYSEYIDVKEILESLRSIHGITAKQRVGLLSAWTDVNEKK
jgi:hypothetical protein